MAPAAARAGIGAQSARQTAASSSRQYLSKRNLPGAGRQARRSQAKPSITQSYRFSTDRITALPALTGCYPNLLRRWSAT
ncbi:MAG: hypothetical protein ACREU3_10110 [Steroidobacteraceae bacterium]